MSDKMRKHLPWLFLMLLGVSAAVVFTIGMPAGVFDPDVIQDLRTNGDIVPLVELLQREELAGARILEAELERENGRLVYELELLDDSGRLYERYYDAISGQAVPER